MTRSTTIITRRRLPCVLSCSLLLLACLALFPTQPVDGFAAWLAEAVSVVEGCGEPEAELLLQQGVTSLEDLAECQSELLTSLPGIDSTGADEIKAKAAVLAVQKAEEEEQARIEAERQAAEEMAAAAERSAADDSGQAPENDSAAGEG